MIKAVIFDMDGVIVDSEPIYEKADKEIFQRYGINLSDKELQNYIGVNLLDIWTDLFNKYHFKGEYKDYEVEDFIEEHVHGHYKVLSESDELALMPGIKEWFEYFKAKSYKMIIASSSYEPIIELIYQKFGLAKYMEGYVDGNSVEKGKPEPDIFLQAAENLGVKAEECLVIEDSEHGISAANQAGMKSIGFDRDTDYNQDLSSADILIKEFNQQNLEKLSL
ncbi:HAD family hydrolase [Halanaerobium hydrogeniformans]|uniref:HAD-superfamily hydrolase, subfamily IA, variant 3 n=1 Tax=Halanaerobium hydrogeniformans TaxID=656519 RepID=E4RJT2_HALHG|nr:HAD family phosphatase [Halanaerobium hydrogeniformans]ADQ15502.1 HAD-superfamily hydrolase, subfamily IA, variant 3 [Halanaerobium hydrogeniformans]